MDRDAVTVIVFFGLMGVFMLGIVVAGIFFERDRAARDTIIGVECVKQGMEWINRDCKEKKW